MFRVRVRKIVHCISVFLLTITIITNDIREENKFCILRSLLAVIVVARKPIIQKSNIFLTL